MPGIQSMTAFARESMQTSAGMLTVELRSVNHRFLDCSFKIPDSLRALEPRLREQMAKALARGKVDCLVRLQQQPTDFGESVVDEQRLADLLEAAQHVAQLTGNHAPPDPLQVLQFPGIYTASEASEDSLMEAASELFTRTLKNLRDSRSREGEKLTALVQDRLDQVAVQVQATREVLPGIMQAQRQRILDRIAELDIEVDQGRLEQELVYLAQRADVDEELDRLETHIGEVERTLKKGGPC
ncbi:MAG: YicC family protein, partial [Halioglobus sp.]|nr:YicC family protein [Halioglobus sp.]